MAQYIDKDALVAEIEKRKKIVEKRLYINNSYSEEGNAAWERDKALYDAYNSLISFIDTLEVKEVDLEKEINTYISNNFFGSKTIGFYANRTKEEPNYQDIALCAKYFFELGLKTQKGEEYDRQSTEN